MPSRSKLLALAIPVAALLSATAFSIVSAPTAGQQDESSFAIIGRDPLTGNYGVAAVSNYPLIGMNLEFLDPDAGAVVVLGGPFIEINEKVLVAIQGGLEPGRAIAVGLVGDEERELRQLLAIAPTGAAAFTGDGLGSYAGDRVGDFFVAGGHGLAGADVLLAMEEAFMASDAPLEWRFIDALRAARDASGDRFEARSAALVIVGPGARFATRDRLLDLRIDYVAYDAVAALADLHFQVDSIYGVSN
jgi:uncharacterized Ntn-hydrolase superfamily protein